jgi:hypothetical protein
MKLVKRSINFEDICEREIGTGARNGVAVELAALSCPPVAQFRFRDFLVLNRKSRRG